MEVDQLPAPWVLPKSVYLEVPAYCLETRSPLNWDSFSVPLMMHVAGLETFKVLFWDLVTRKERSWKHLKVSLGQAQGWGSENKLPHPSWEFTQEEVTTSSFSSKCLVSDKKKFAQSKADI